MLSSDVGRTVRVNRVAKGITRIQLASQAGVSVRLLAEFERGARPNVSMETALRLLRLLGVSLEPAAASHTSAQASRAAVRRATWHGRIMTLAESGERPAAPRSIAARMAGVTEASELVHALAQDQRRRSRASGGRGGTRNAG